MKKLDVCNYYNYQFLTHNYQTLTNYFNIYYLKIIVDLLSGYLIY